DVLAAEVLEGMAAPAVASVRAQPLVPRAARQRRRRVAVVDYDQPAPSERPDRLPEPPPGPMLERHAPSWGRLGRQAPQLGRRLAVGRDEQLLERLGDPHFRPAVV